MSGGKKTIMPADVFRALDDIEYGFMREKLEAEFASTSDPPPIPSSLLFPFPILPSISPLSVSFRSVLSAET